MDAQTCLKKLQYVGVLAFATVDACGAPQIRIISAIHYESGEEYRIRSKNCLHCGNCREVCPAGAVEEVGR